MVPIDFFEVKFYLELPTILKRLPNNTTTIEVNECFIV